MNLYNMMQNGATLYAHGGEYVAILNGKRYDATGHEFLCMQEDRELALVSTDPVTGEAKYRLRSS